ncbi:Eukaryotic aspartyl protease family protein [Theileria parva strain Muguga]|uniref:Eukaryotic aspartyl protease family protein n=1 Tax=Theileria parva strain Muguga TaxID=333668 RepID=UPI001C61BF91|nr:Eukaryotic aspartyl protease family protein [Theileria parva strain Muguga]KAF5153448.1 Eukaryotic aspartyl protease family protein [Theileria parva strain Muguga]
MLLYYIIVLFVLNYTRVISSIPTSDSLKKPFYEIQLHKSEDSDEHYYKILNAERSSQYSTKFYDLKNVLSSTISLKADYTSRLWATYYGNIILGSNNNENNSFKVLFDTGSSEFWVPYEMCLSQQCLNRKRYHKGSEWIAKHDKHGNYVPLEIKYLSGQIDAIDGTATVNLLNGITLKDVNVGLATNINIPFLDNAHWDGIVGLGFKTKDMESRGSRPLFESIMYNKSLYPNFRNQVAYYVTKNGGNISFGGINPNYKRSLDDEFLWAPVVKDSIYWTLKLKNIKIKNNNINHKSNSLAKQYEFTNLMSKIDDVKVIMDTGSFLIYAPQSMGPLLSRLQVSSCEEMKHKPNLIFVLEGNKGSDVNLELRPEDYTIIYEGSDGEKHCSLGIVPDNQQEELGFSAWTFGELFMRAYYTVYDYESREVGFAPSKKSD